MSYKFKAGDKVRAVESYICPLSGRVPFLKGEIYEVRHAGHNLLRVEVDSLGGRTTSMWACKFELVEEPTLKDLREKALEALDLGLLTGVSLRDFSQGLRLHLFLEDGSVIPYNSSTVQMGLDYIESLKCETFTIETQQDIANIKPQAKGVHANGVEFVAKSSELDTVRGMGCVVGYGVEGRGYNARLYLEELKGATITQQKEIK